MSGVTSSTLAAFCNAASRRFLELEAERDAALAERDELREALAAIEAVVDTDAYRLAAGITCVPGQSHSCGDAHHIGRCYKPSVQSGGK